MEDSSLDAGREHFTRRAACVLTLDQLQAHAAEMQRIALMKRTEATEANRAAREASAAFATALDAKLNDHRNGKAT